MPITCRFFGACRLFFLGRNFCHAGLTRPRRQPPDDGTRAGAELFGWSAQKMKCSKVLAVLLLWCVWGDSLQADAASSVSALVVRNVRQLLQTNSCPACDLRGADLSQMRLARANLEKADLTGARLSMADLRGANLRGANLQGADLKGADLSLANLNGARLAGTSIEGAIFRETKIKGRTVNRLLHADAKMGRDVAIAKPPAGGAQRWTVEQPALIKERVAAHQQPVTVPARDPEPVVATPPEPAAVASSPRDEPATPVEQGEPAPPVEEVKEPTSAEVVPSSTMQRVVDEVRAGASPRPQSVLESVLPALPAPVADEPPMPTDSEAVSQDELSPARQELVERMFKEKRCVGCDLSRIDLSGRGMRGFDLEGANLEGSNLCDANLREANLKGANLRGAQLREANLRKADLYGADCGGADLTEANLRDALVDGVNFIGATGVNLEKARQPQ
jgi:uncharacterized protein YjbI with pentapeptide repeats